MKMPQSSPTFVIFLRLFEDLRPLCVTNPVYRTTITSDSIVRESTGHNTQRYPQSFSVTKQDLIDKCTIYEWYMIGHIEKELKDNNALWHFDEHRRNNSAARKAIKGLVSKGIMSKTETAYIYWINPIYIRRGEVMNVVMTTAQVLSRASAVTLDHIINKKPAKDFLFSSTDKGNTPEIGYGMPIDPNF